MQETTTETRTGFFERLNEWRKPYVADRQFMLLLSFFVGLLAAVAAFVLQIGRASCRERV